ncbi:general secretion pathway protein GspB [Rheinheimera sp. 4Y26]|uniref:general secretion pathway protein GspB n=1 Tax=Rheinheimera sp. 4Y26 TaxID=2977811 RepID=UPI0021B0DC8B|nr:general secretion pathway protein GspB [Rheinheimera sp. 4Y26]MCT6698854.1 general secretion pathway protein GspB [Rheinheimera sp. 4Y26]
MSLLMEALKQQQGQQPMPAQPVAYSQPAPTPNAQGWKMLALLLLVLVGLLAGFLLAQYLQKPPTAPVAAVVPLQPASAGQILTDLLTVPPGSASTQADSSADESRLDDSADQSSEEPQLLVSAQPRSKRQTQQGLDEQVALVAGERTAPEPQNDVVATDYADEFQAQPEMAEASLADEVAPMAQPELSANEVSDELKSKFALALEETGSAPRRQSVTEHAAPARDINSLDELLKRQIPPLRFEAHVYATEPKQRWVKVNGKDLQEGQWVTADIQIKEITPQYVLLQTGRQLFSVEALSEWSYRLPGR